MEICENLEKTKQKISHELQVKESQVNFQEGQLNSSKKQIEKLEQELKRCKSELERSQQAAQSADVSLNACITPQKIFTTPLTPSQYYSGSKYEDLKEKYNKEVEERKRLEAEVKTLQAKCTALEQKLKKLTEDLSCQRQNAESAKRSLEQKIKEKEKEFQEVTSVKHQLEKNLEEFKQKFNRTEQALEASQIKENELRRSSEEMKRENSLLKSQSEQRDREVCHLEEELKKARQCLSQSQNFAEEMRAKNTSQETMLRDLQGKINQQENSLTLEKLKLALADLEKQRDCSQDLLKKREHHIEQLNEKLSKTERESEALLSALELKKKEYEELKEEKTLFSRWKSENEQLLSQMESEKESLQSKINHLETCLKTQQIKSHEHNERVRTLEMERENLSVEIRNLHNVIDSKTAEVETQKRAYGELQQKAEFSDQKHEKEMENMCLKISQLTGQVGDLEHKLQLLSSEIMDKDQRYQDLHAESESLRDLLKSKDSSRVTNEAHQRSLLTFEQQPAMNNSFANIIGEQGSEPSERSECHLEPDQSPKNSAMLQNRVVSLEFSLESQKQMNSDLQKQCEELVQIRGEIEENLMKAEQMHQSFVAETSQRLSKLQEDTSVHQNVVAETLAALESKERELQLLNEKLETEHAEIQELKKSNHLLQESLKELQLLSETLSLEKKEMGSIISLNKMDIEELTQENGTLKETNANLTQEKMNLLQKSESFSNCIDERDKRISELSNQYKQERLTLLQRCEETGNAFQDLSEKYKAVQEKNSKLECLLNECMSVCEDRKNELEQLKETFAREQQGLVSQLALAEERNQNLVLELETVQRALTAEITDNQNNSKREADGLKQEIMTLKEEQSKRQKEVNALLQENEHLMKLMKAEHEHQHVELEPTQDSVKGGERETNKCHVQLPMDLEVTDASLDSYNAQLVQLETKVRNMELKLQESEKEKEHLQHELQTIRRELETGNLQQDIQPQDINGLGDCEINPEGKYISVLHELSVSPHDSPHLQGSLQTVMGKLNELEKMCEGLQVEKFELISELNESRSECITATSKMAEEVGKLVNEVKILNNENGLLQGESGKAVSESEFGEQQNEQNSVSLNPLEDSNFYEHLTVSNKEVQMHFAELQEKFSSLQSEHKILHDQHCQMSSKMSELQSYVDTLKAENSVLSMNLRNSQGDLVKEVKPGPGEERLLSLSFSCVTDSPGGTSLGESSFYKDLLEQTGETSLLNNLEGTVSVNQSNVEEESCSSLEEENRTKNEIPAAPARRIEELETLCQMYLQSLKKLEEKIESQGIMKNKEIKELERLLSSSREELGCLRKQYLSENEQWQQKLTRVTVEMESKLAAEKKHTEHLTLELEVARLQLQGLDLSSRSLLGADIDDATRGGNDSCDIRESEEYTSETKERPPKHEVHQICEKDAQQDLSIEMERITETDALRLTGEWSREQPPEASHETPEEDETQGCSESMSELSLSGPNALAPMDFLENQVTIQNLQFQVKEASDENLRLLHGIEERDQKVESLLNEIKALDSKLNLQEVQLTTKIEACIELEKIVEELKKEKSDLTEQLESFSCDNQKVEISGGLATSLEMGTDKLSDEVIEDDVAKVSDSLRERCPAGESELNFLTSEKGSTEHPALSAEADLEVVQTEKLYLEKDNENKQKVITCLEEELSVVTSERDQLHGELDILSKENKELDQMSEKMKAKIQELEFHQGECIRLQEQLQSLEKDSQALSLVRSGLENQIGQLKKEKESLVRESESLQAKLSESEHEKLTVAKALEAALMEKGEVAVRLSSTQEEVHQLRKGIEKLRVRIEADEKKQLHISEKLKESERRNDSLQDKVENLERELQMSEENQELVILDAENSKAEVETLKTQIELTTKSLKALELDLVTIQSEKENLMKELQEKQSQVSKSDTLLSSLKNLLEEKEQEKIQMKEESRTAVEMLQAQLKELSEEAAALYDDQETWKVRDLSLGSPVEAAHQLGNSIGKLKVHLDAEKKQQLHILEKLKESQHHAGLLKDRVEDLEKELEVSGQNQECVILEAEKSKAEVETLKAKIEEMAQNLRGLELDLVHMRSEKEDLTTELQKEQGRVSELGTLNSSLENLLQEKEQEKVQMKDKSKAAVEMLQTQLRELNEKVAALCDDQETWQVREQNLSSQVDSLEHEKTQLLQGLDEAKSNYIVLQSSVNGLIQEVEEGKRKLEKKDEEISILKNQTQDQEQLVSKLSQMEGEQQLWKKQKTELGDLTVELEQKIQVLQSQNDTLQDALEALQHSSKDLEKELELIKTEKMSFIEKGQLKELMLENSELKKSLDCVHKEQMEKQEKMREEIAEYQLQLQEAEKKHQDLLLDTNKQYEMEIQTYREKLTSTEECLSSQKVEIDLLKSSKEELNNSLKAATERLEELKKTKMENLKYADKLKRENDRAQGKIKLLIKSCKQLEEEKEMLQKELSHLEAAQEKQEAGTVADANVDELMTEIKELKETLEEKTKEADEYLDKYCSLLISHEKLEKAREILETQVARLSSQQSKVNLRSSPLLNSVVPGPSPVPSATEKKLSAGQNKASGKRQRSSGIREGGGETTPSTPEMFSKKSRKVVKSGIHPAEDPEDTEFEPEGLPEVVKKGFADIPTGKSSPYVLRRTTMATRTSPRLAAQKLTPSPLSLDKENLAETSKPTAGGSRSQKVKVTHQSPADSGAGLREPTTKILSVSNPPERSLADSPKEGLRAKRGRPAPSPEAGPGSESSENCRVQ
ncbi:centromere protein F [Camelus ferus]|nr:centromere protein F [Camelus ferus]